MKYLHLIWAALFRSKTRPLLTPLSVIAAAFLLFGMLACTPKGGVQAGVGVRSLEVDEPITGTRVPIAIFYPSDQTSGDTTTQVGPFRIEAQRDAVPNDQRRPLIVLSHGSGGDRWGHRDLAVVLARHGYIVAAVEHPGDSYDDRGGIGTDRVFRGRAYQVSAAITALLAEPTFAPRIDAARIGVAGFSAGGYTALLLLGAQPDFSRWAGYCQRHPEDPEFCGEGVPSLSQINVLHDPPAMTDPRVKAAFVMAPLGFFFGPHAFDGVKAPVFLYEAAADKVLLPAENSRNVQRGLANLYAFRSVPDAGHFVFLAPCEAAFAKRVPKLCRDPYGVDRVAVHALIQRDAEAFFDQMLKPATNADGAKP